MRAITRAIRDGSLRYWEDDPEFGRVWNLSRYCEERHWPAPLKIDGKSYSRRVRRRSR